MKSKTFYYARVSTKDQNLARQLAVFYNMGADFNSFRKYSLNSSNEYPVTSKLIASGTASGFGTIQRYTDT